MSYTESRDAGQLQRLAIATEKFIDRWNDKDPKTKRRTLFLLPGGMGSALYRAKTPYDDNGPAIQPFDFSEKIWLTVCTLASEAPRLAMQRDNAGVYRDTDNRIIIPDGSVSFFGTDPYRDFLKWCDKQKIDHFTFGWDWRRPVAEAVDFFVDRFLPMFQEQVELHCKGDDPLANYSLVGHSFSGMFINHFLRRQQLPGNCTRAIAVAGLFHGYGGQIHRYFQRDSMFQLLDRMEMVRVQTSLPGCYELPFLPHPVYQAHSNELGAPMTCALTRYPSQDVNGGGPVDPFNAGAGRYPTDTGFDSLALKVGKNNSLALSTPLPPARQAIFKAIRGIVTDNDYKVLNTTPGGLKWGKLGMPPYKPSQNPIVDGPKVPGDDTLPCWSTRMFEGNPITVMGPDVDHVNILDIEEVQTAIGGLI